MVEIVTHISNRYSVNPDGTLAPDPAGRLHLPTLNGALLPPGAYVASLDLKECVDDIYRSEVFLPAYAPILSQHIVNAVVLPSPCGLNTGQPSRLWHRVFNRRSNYVRIVRADLSRRYSATAEGYVYPDPQGIHVLKHSEYRVINPGTRIYQAKQYVDKRLICIEAPKPPSDAILAECRALIARVDAARARKAELQAQITASKTAFRARYGFDPTPFLEQLS